MTLGSDDFDNTDDDSQSPFDSGGNDEFFKLLAFVDAVHALVSETSKDFARSRTANRPPASSDKTLKALGELARRHKGVEGLLDKVQHSGQSFN